MLDEKFKLAYLKGVAAYAKTANKIRDEFILNAFEADLIKQENKEHLAK